MKRMCLQSDPVIHQCMSLTRELSRNAVAVFAGITTLLFAALAGATQPIITLIEPFRTNQVIIHFNTEANLTYTLQYTESVVLNGQPDSIWWDLYVAPKLPFATHYIIVDTRIRPRRFYRLKVTY